MIVLSGEDKVLDKLDKLSKITSNEVFLKQLAASINGKFKQNISSGIDANRNNFEPLSEYTKNKRGRGGESSIPLNDDGFLLGGMNTFIENGKIIFANSQDYALYHQLGNENLPIRQIYPTVIQDYMIIDIQNAINYEIERIINEV